MECSDPKIHPLLKIIILLIILFSTMSCGFASLVISTEESLLEDKDATLIVGEAMEAVRLATQEARILVVEETLLPNSAQEYAFQTGTHCIDAPGEDPCPLDLCIAPADSYRFLLDVSSELFGKANPDDYSCAADLRITNNTAVDLTIIYQVVGSEQDIWGKMQLAGDDLINDRVINFYTRKDGKVMHQSVPAIVVIYGNPHCQWIQPEDIKLTGYLIPVMNPCESK